MSAVDAYRSVEPINSEAGVEVFVFHWGCTRLGALGDDQRGPTVCAHGGAEPFLPPLDNCSGTSRADLFLGMRCFVPERYKTKTKMVFCTRNVEAPDIPVTDTEMKYCISSPID